MLLVDDDAGTRALVRILLERTRKFRVVAEAETGATAVELAERVQPDVVVMDWDMPGMSGIEALRIIRKKGSRSKLVVFSDRVATLSEPEARACEADLLVPKGSDCSGLVPALLGIQSVTNGGLLRATIPPSGANARPSRLVRMVEHAALLNGAALLAA